jgi:5-methylcytosine-specific restriction endonuclease McrA
MKRSAYTRQGGVCPLCKGSFELEQMEGDHILPWSQGGHTTPDNLQMLCRQCNREKATK